MCVLSHPQCSTLRWVNGIFVDWQQHNLSVCCPQAIESAIGGNAYQHSKVNQWTTSVVEQSLSQLTKLGKPFKYIVTCVIMQKNGAGLHTASSCFWDNSSDGTCTVRWENKTMYCIVSAFGLAIWLPWNWLYFTSFLLRHLIPSLLKLWMHWTTSSFNVLFQ